MKALKLTVFSLIILFVVLWVTSYMISSKYNVQRSIVINAPPDSVYSYVNTLKNWNYWSPWQERDPKMKIKYEGPASGVGATQEWTSDKLGSGMMQIIEADQNRKVIYEMRSEGFESASRGIILLEPVQEGTKVTWLDNGDLGPSPFSKYFKLVIDGMIGPDFEQGLKNLKQCVEKKEH